MARDERNCSGSSTVATKVNAVRTLTPSVFIRRCALSSWRAMARTRRSKPRSSSASTSRAFSAVAIPSKAGWSSTSVRIWAG